MAMGIGLVAYDDVDPQLLMRSQRFRYGNCRTCLSPGYAGDRCFRCLGDIVIQLIHRVDDGNVKFVNPVGVAFLCARGEWCMEMIPEPQEDSPIRLYGFRMDRVRRLCQRDQFGVYFNGRFDQRRILCEAENEEEYCAFKEVDRIVKLIINS